MSEIKGELCELEEEAKRVRMGRPGIRIQWSESFKRRAVELLKHGVSVGELVNAVKVGEGTIQEWRKRFSFNFSEVKVVTERKRQDAGQSQGGSISMTTRRGHTLQLSLSVMRQFFQENLL